MADVEQRLRVVIEADGTAKFSDGTKLSADQVRRLGDELDRTTRQVDSFSDRTSSAARNVTSLGRDVAQGDWRGAAENLGRMAANSGMLEKAVSGVSLSYTIAGAALAAFAVAAYQANEETKRQANLLLVTGNYAGLVSGELNQMARSAASGIGGSVGKQRRISADTLVTVPVTLFFDSTADADSFETWFYTGGGMDWFDFTLPRTGSVVQARIVAGDIGRLVPLRGDWVYAKRQVKLEYVRAAL